MARNSTLNEECRKNSENKILKEAIRQFAQKGYAATKTTDIVQAAGISQGLLYHYFPVKSDLYHRCIEVCIQSNQDALLPLFHLPISATEKIKQLTVFMLKRMQENETLLYQFLMFTHISFDPLQGEFINQFEQIPVNKLANTIRQAQTEGSAVDGDPDTLSALYWAAIKGVCMHMISKHRAYPVPTAEMIYHILLK